MATLIFLLVQHFAPRRYDRKDHPATATWWPLLSKCTFGIYLSQMIVLRQVVWSLTPWLARTHWVVDSLVSAIIAFIVCWLLVLLLRMTPLRRFLVGK